MIQGEGGMEGVVGWRGKGREKGGREGAGMEEEGED